MDTPTPPPAPEFRLADDFSLPPLGPEAMRITNAVHQREHYVSVPLMSATARERVFGHAYPQHPVGGFACRGFVIHTVELTDEGIVADGIAAPPPGMDELAFLRLCLGLNSFLRPGPDFNDREPPLYDIVAALGRTGIPAATGVHISVRPNEPEVAVPALILPRVYISEFGSRQSVDSAETYAAHVAAALFHHLTNLQLEALEHRGKGQET